MLYINFLKKVLLLGTFLMCFSCQESTSSNDNSHLRQAQNTPTKTVEVTGVNANEISFKKENGKNKAYQKGQLFSGVAINYFANEKPQYSTSYKDGDKHGEWRIWFTNGNIQKTGNTLNGKEDGIYQEYYQSGELKYEYHYNAGKKIKNWKSWYENGQQWTSRDFKNDILDGKVLVWDTDGTLTKEYTYKNGALLDKQFYFEEE